ncbi:MAG: hypothetical protein K2Q18_10175 [Bdellovibrionales bacterium]|nr:hypothetical protein [Bdellovibrionales bacterium]
MKNAILKFTLPPESKLDVFDNQSIKIVCDKYFFIFTIENQSGFKLVLELISGNFFLQQDDPLFQEKINVINQLLKQGNFNISLISNEVCVSSLNIEVLVMRDFELNIPSNLAKLEYQIKISEYNYLISSNESPFTIKIDNNGLALIQELLLKKSNSFTNDIEFWFQILLTNFLYPFEENLKNHSHSMFWEDHDRVFIRETRIHNIFQKKAIGATFPFPQSPLPVLDVKHTQTFPLTVSENTELPVIFKNRESKRIGVRDKNISLQDVSSFLEMLSNKIPHSELSTGHHIYPIPGNISSHEFLIFNNACEDIPKGVYILDKPTMTLRMIEDTNLKIYMKIYSRTWGKEYEPQMAIQVLKNYPSLGWKYRSINLRVSLIEAGGILQSAQLLASHLNLSVCPFGTGPNVPLELSDGKYLDWVPVLDFSLEKLVL